MTDSRTVVLTRGVKNTIVEVVVIEGTTTPKTGLVFTGSIVYDNAAIIDDISFVESPDGTYTGSFTKTQSLSLSVKKQYVLVLDSTQLRIERECVVVNA